MLKLKHLFIENKKTCICTTYQNNKSFCDFINKAYGNSFNNVELAIDLFFTDKTNRRLYNVFADDKMYFYSQAAKGVKWFILNIDTIDTLNKIDKGRL